ncbi:MAG: RNA polymerase sigma factor [Planctomycetes bacterium]|jgi:RNA polymerase sigma-70 factor (ECF subfamily)|nr:RNA polymerase sigma factor [Planctomycetota bacterium]
MSGPIELPLRMDQAGFPLCSGTALDGFREVFDACVREHGAPLYRLALRLTGAAADAEDLVQEALLRGWRGIASFRGEAALGTWLFRIVLNLGRRRRKRFRPLPDELSGVVDPAEKLARRELLDRVMAEVHRLPRRQSEALLLRASAGLGHREIAGVMGITAAAVKSHLAQARRRILARFPGEVLP